MRRDFYVQGSLFLCALLASVAFPVRAAESAELYVGPAQAKTSAVVDVRSAAEFDRARIPGSLHIPLFSLKAKAALLKDDAYVLVGRPADAARLESETRALRAQGLRVSILAGGLYGWKTAGMPLEGTNPAGENLNLTPLPSSSYIRTMGHVCSIPGCTGHSCATCKQ